MIFKLFVFWAKYLLNCPFLSSTTSYNINNDKTSSNQAQVQHISCPQALLVFPPCTEEICGTSTQQLWLPHEARTLLLDHSCAWYTLPRQVFYRQPLSWPCQLWSSDLHPRVYLCLKQSAHGASSSSGSRLERVGRACCSWRSPLKICFHGADSSGRWLENIISRTSSVPNKLEPWF